MNPQAKMIADIYEEEKPELWKRSYPRNYSGVGHYESPRYVATIIASSIDWTTNENRQYSPLTARHIAMVASKAFQNNLPAFFVEREFLLAVSNTDLPDDIKWTDAKLPFEAGLIYLPKKVLIDPEGDSVTVLGWARIYKRDGLIVESQKVILDDDSFVVFGVCDSDIERLYSSAVRADEMPYIKWKTGDTKPVSPFDMPLSTDDKSFLHQLVCVTFSLLMAHISKPELITQERREAQRKKNLKRETYTPNFLGKGYTIKREHQGGMHESPRLHWRKGHFRAQHYGVKSQQVKTIWIEPTLVGDVNND